MCPKCLGNRFLMEDNRRWVLCREIDCGWRGEVNPWLRLWCWFNGHAYGLCITGRKTGLDTIYQESKNICITCGAKKG